MKFIIECELNEENFMEFLKESGGTRGVDWECGMEEIVATRGAEDCSPKELLSICEKLDKNSTSITDVIIRD